MCIPRDRTICRQSRTGPDGDLGATTVGGASSLLEDVRTLKTARVTFLPRSRPPPLAFPFPLGAAKVVGEKSFWLREGPVDDASVVFEFSAGGQTSHGKERWERRGFEVDHGTRGGQDRAESPLRRRGGRRAGPGTPASKGRDGPDGRRGERVGPDAESPCARPRGPTARRPGVGRRARGEGLFRGPFLSPSLLKCRPFRPNPVDDEVTLPHDLWRHDSPLSALNPHRHPGFTSCSYQTLYSLAGLCLFRGPSPVSHPL